MTKEDASSGCSTLDGLVRVVRETGRAGSWAGETELSEAVLTVLTDPVIKTLPDKQSVDKLVLTALASWNAADLDNDEYFLEHDPSPSINIQNLSLPSPLNDEARKLLGLRLIQLARSPGTSPVTVSFLAQLLRFTDRKVASELYREYWPAAAAAIRARRAVPRDPDLNTRLRDDATIVERVSVLSRTRRQHLDKLADLDAYGGWMGLCTFAEFGYRSLWTHPEHDKLRQVLETALPWATAYKDKNPLPTLRPVQRLTARQDSFFRSILAVRLSKIAIGRHRMEAWDYFNTALLMPFARLVREAASSQETAQLAERVVAVCMQLEARSAAWNEERQAKLLGRISREQRFKRLLYLAVAPATATAGAAYAAAASHLPEIVAGPASVLGVFLVRWLIHRARNRSGFLWWQLPKRAGVVGAVTFAWYGAIVATYFVIGAIESSSYVLYASLLFGSLTLAWVLNGQLRSTAAPRIRFSDFIPDVVGARPLSEEVQLALDVFRFTEEATRTARQR